MTIRPEFVEETGRQIQRTITLLWLALTATPLFFIAVGWFLSTQPGGEAPGLDPMIRQVLLAAAGALLAASVVFRIVVAKPERAARGAPSVPRRSARVVTVPAESEEERRLQGAAQRMSTFLITGLALSEAAAVMGLVLTVLSRDPTYVAACAGAAFLVDLIVHRPPAELVKKLSKLDTSAC